MAFTVEFREPIYDSGTHQWILIGSLDLKIDERHYRTLTKKLWLSQEARFNEGWFLQAKRTIREELEQRAKRELAAMLQHRPPQEVATFERISIPLVRRIYPQLIASQIVGVQPLSGPTSLTFYERFRYSGNRGGCIVKEAIEQVNWKTEGF